MAADTAVIALGSNLSGPWGTPETTLRRAIVEMSRHSIAVLRCSSIHHSEPVGPGQQPAYANAVCCVETELGPRELLSVLKGLEAEAGRQSGPRWGPRTLDLDIIDHGGRIVGWDVPYDWTAPAELTLPHPELHRRRFVLEPLAEILPDWRHPVLRMTAAQLLARLPPAGG